MNHVVSLLDGTDCMALIIGGRCCYSTVLNNYCGEDLAECSQYVLIIRQCQTGPLCIGGCSAFYQMVTVRPACKM